MQVSSRAISHVRMASIIMVDDEGRDILRIVGLYRHFQTACRPRRLVFSCRVELLILRNHRCIKQHVHGPPDTEVTACYVQPIEGNGVS
jgi:hypothetical protein